MKRPKTGEMELALATAKEPPRWTDPETWVPGPGKPRVLAIKFLDMLAKGRAAGLHPMRVRVLEAPAQGYEVMWCSGAYTDPGTQEQDRPW